MKSLLISGIIFFTLLSCSRPTPSQIEFEGLTFELPIEVRKAQNQFGLQYGYYTGFYQGDAGDKSIATQFENYPVFMGSDNDSEKSYYGKYLVGITFFRANIDLALLRSDLENKYGRKFKTATKDFGVTRTKPPFTMTYHYLKTDEGVYIVIKEIERTYLNKKYVAISFYKGIQESELGKYLEHVG
jgi:hypothetical protein